MNYMQECLSGLLRQVVKQYNMDGVVCLYSTAVQICTLQALARRRLALPSLSIIALA